MRRVFASRAVGVEEARGRGKGGQRTAARSAGAGRRHQRRCARARSGRVAAAAALPRRRLARLPAQQTNKPTTTGTLVSIKT
eukprot:COSAG06_NODE_2771_length_6311_cov_12.386671_4_plen_82_part_00